jgi:hypothetical protein
MNFKTFETTIGTLVIAERALEETNEENEIVQHKEFVYTRPQTVEAHPEIYVPYDWVEEETWRERINGNMVRGILRRPTVPTKQEA